MDPPLYPCSYENCSKTFKKRSRLEIHLRTHTGERPFLCGVPGCDRSYVRSQHLYRHIQRVHFLQNKLQERVACPHCGDELANTFCLEKHVKNFHSISSQARVYKCSYENCDEAFHKKQHLVRHRLQHDDQLSGAMRIYSCPHEGCNRHFAFPGKLKRHMKVHQGYPCNVDGCDEVLENWSQLRRHRATVHCPTFNCDTCGTVFKSRSNLNQHLKMHAPDVEPIMCTWEGCSRTFLYKKNLKQHIRSFHEGEVVFKKKPKARSETESGNATRTRRRKKKISAVASLFALDDRGKELKVSRRNLPGIEEKSGADSDIQSNQSEEKRSTSSSTVSLTGTELDVFLSSLPCDNATSTNFDSVEENQHENLCKSSKDSLTLNSSSYAIVSVLPCTTELLADISEVS